MSRIGKQPVRLESGVTASVSGGKVHVEGKNGKLDYAIPEGVIVQIRGDTIEVTRDDSVPRARALHGLARSLIQNMVSGAKSGFAKELEVVGVGYRAVVKGDVLSLTIGYSHPVDYRLPKGIQATVDKNTRIILNGADRELVGRVAAKIRSFREPEPYQGKGIRYVDEKIIRKAGKAAAGAGAK
jgi:large subunit ribosomal protein L6